MKKAVQQNWCDLKLKKVIIEIAPGDHFINCEFDRCTFVGCGEARLTACHFIECSLPHRLVGVFAIVAALHLAELHIADDSRFTVNYEVTVIDLLAQADCIQILLHCLIPRRK